MEQFVHITQILSAVMRRLDAERSVIELTITLFFAKNKKIFLIFR